MGRGFRRRYVIRLVAMVALVAAAALRWLAAAPGTPESFGQVPRLPRLTPDYVGITLPPNIAPLNFAIQEPGVAYRVRLQAARGKPIDVASKTPSITIPLCAWRELLDQNRGGDLTIDVYVEQPAGVWNRFVAIDNVIAHEEIDSHLVYRLLGAVFVSWGELGIYQRSLETFDEQPILRNTSIQHGCVNCHSFAGGNPRAFSLHVRPPGTKPFAPGMIAVADSQAARVAHAPPDSSGKGSALPTYTSRHPRAALAAVSLTRSEQFFHGAGPEVREVYDRYSDLALVDLTTGEMSSPPSIADPDRIETFPAWSADGTYLYFCSAPARAFDSDRPPFVGCDTVQYDLMRVPYDVTMGRCGTVEPVLTAQQTGLSISEPRASPDGRFLLFCMTSHGAFPVLQSDSDLYLLDLRPGREFAYWPLTEANSSDTDSWHSWSSNSRWIVFSSKRDNGFLSRPYFCRIDDEGGSSKPFVLPQRQPLFYDRYLRNYNVPELTRGAVQTPTRTLIQAIMAAPDAAPRASDGRAALN